MSLNPQCVDFWEDFKTGALNPSYWINRLTGAVIDDKTLSGYNMRNNNRYCMECVSNYPAAASGMLTMPDGSGFIQASSTWGVGFAFNFSSAGEGAAVLPAGSLYTARELPSLTDYGAGYFSLIINQDSTLSIQPAQGLIIHDPTPPVTFDTWYWVELVYEWQLIFDPLNDVWKLNVAFNAGYEFMGKKIYNPDRTSGLCWVGGFVNQESNAHQFSGGTGNVRFADIYLTKGQSSTNPTYQPFFADSRLDFTGYVCG